MATDQRAGSWLRFSTGNLPERDRLAIWREAMARSVARLDVEPVGERFRSASTTRLFGDLAMSNISIAAVCSQRTCELVADGNDSRRSPTMMRIALPFALLTTVLALAQPAQAAPLTRTFVSAAGLDSNPCTITQPCATFAQAYSLTAASGIIAALDPGKYGPVTITGPITINGNGWAAITAPAAGNGITINASASNVTLTGLNIDGAAAGYNGIVANAVGSLTISNCVLQNFVDNATTGAGNGIVFLPTAGPVTFAITNTTAANNTHSGIFYFPQGGSFNAIGVIDHVVANANIDGIKIVTNFVTGGTTAIAISNSIVSANTAGIDLPSIVSGTLKVSIDNVSVTGNGGTGITATSTANVLLGRSVITGNSTGVFNGTSPNTFFTYQNNQIDLNNTDVGGTVLNTTKPPR